MRYNGELFFKGNVYFLECSKIVFILYLKLEWKFFDKIMLLRLGYIL